MRFFGGNCDLYTVWTKKKIIRSLKKSSDKEIKMECVQKTNSVVQREGKFEKFGEWQSWFIYEAWEVMEKNRTWEIEVFSVPEEANLIRGQRQTALLNQVFRVRAISKENILKDFECSGPESICSKYPGPHSLFDMYLRHEIHWKPGLGE